MSEITICSVSYECYDYLGLNWELTTLLNPDMDINWLIADNAMESEDKRVPIGDRRFNVYEGEPKGNQKANWHHAKALMMLLKYVSDRFVLVLDPDFFIVRKEWVKDVINYMKGKNISMFGAQWYPGAYYKMRYFPSPHCLFIDLELIRKQDLDFCPPYVVPTENKNNGSGVKYYFEKYFQRGGRFLDITERARIGQSKDTGYRIIDRFLKKKGIHSECLQAVFISNRGIISDFIDLMLPDRLSFTPKKRGYTVETTFREMGFPIDVYSEGWEEFMWKGEPFGFHVRRYPKRKRGGYDVDGDLQVINAVIKKLAGQ